MENTGSIKLTKYSHGAGCGCKISPKVLRAILGTDTSRTIDPRLLVGNDTNDDAAVFDLGDGTAIISTTDFFMPIVDDPFTFGRIAAVNAISDIYAMGGQPLLAIAILGWPVNLIDPNVARVVLEGGRYACQEAGIPLAGGHSIDSPEPIFGLAVTGKVEKEHIKKNNTAHSGDLLILTKPLGVGILTTAQKQGKLRPEHEMIAPDSMVRLNSIGQQFGQMKAITAMTDVTGFGLLGHLSEMCTGSNLSAVIEYEKVPRFDHLGEYVSANCIPGGTNRNWESYGHMVQLKDENSKALLCDPQTNGGLLIAVDNNAWPEVKQMLRENKIMAEPFGILKEKDDWLIIVR